MKWRKMVGAGKKGDNVQGPAFFFEVDAGPCLTD
jgi:hypothetical protein